MNIIQTIIIAGVAVAVSLGGTVVAEPQLEWPNNSGPNIHPCKVNADSKACREHKAMNKAKAKMKKMKDKKAQ